MFVQISHSDCKFVMSSCYMVQKEQLQKCFIGVMCVTFIFVFGGFSALPLGLNFGPIPNRK